MSDVCEVFSCPPDVALRQDWHLVQAILEERAARRAVDLFNQGGEGFEALKQSPGLQEVLLEMHRAQSGAGVSLDDVYRTMESDG